MVGVIADITGLIVIEEAVRAVVNGDAENRHVVGVHHAVSETDGLPMGDQARRPFHHVGKPQQVTLSLILQLRPVTGNDEIRQLPHLLRLFAVVKCSKWPKRTWLSATRISMAPRSGCSRNTGCRPVTMVNARVVGIPDDAAPRRPETRGSPSAAPRGHPHTRIGRQPGALQVPVAVAAVRQDLFAQ